MAAALAVAVVAGLHHAVLVKLAPPTPAAPPLAGIRPALLHVADKVLLLALVLISHHFGVHLGQIHVVVAFVVTRRVHHPFEMLLDAEFDVEHAP